MTRSSSLFLASLLMIPLSLRADATRQDWIGDFAMDHDGHLGTLRLAASLRRCISLPCAGLDAQYTDQNGATYPTHVEALDQDGQHLAFTVAFPGSPQRFDLYIFSFEKSRLAGTTVWQGRTFGVSATRAGISPAARAGAYTSLSPAASSATRATAPVVLATAPPPAPTGTPVKTLGPDGSITLRYPDGRVVTRKIGSCGSKTTLPNGKVTQTSCAYSQVTQLVPPDPPSGSPQDRWLRAQDDALLSILQALLDGSSFQNYLTNYENPPDRAIYKQVYFRTKAIADFTNPQ